MKVVLLEHIRGIGRAGDIKEVSDGYARNFLLPRGLGRPANDSTLREIETIRTRKLEAHSMARAEAEAVLAKLDGSTVKLEGTANEHGTLFSGITERDIAERLTAAAGMRIDPRAVAVQGHIKHTGTHAVEVRLTDGITAHVTVEVTAR